MSLVDNVLAHYGAKGMKWGVRNDKASKSAPTDVTLKMKPGRAVKTSGGKNQPASSDAKTAAVTRQIAKKSSTDALSSRDLKSLVDRMQMEANYTRLAVPQKSAGRKFVERMFKDKNARTQTVSVASKSLKVVSAPITVGRAIKRADLSGIGR